MSEQNVKQLIVSYVVWHYHDWQSNDKKYLLRVLPDKVIVFPMNEEEYQKHLASQEFTKSFEESTEKL